MVSGVPDDGRHRHAPRLFHFGFYPKVMLAPVLAACAFLVFVLPLFVPSAPVRAISASYLAGFNNSVAVMGAAALSVAVLLLAMMLQPREPVILYRLSQQRRISGMFTCAVIAATSVILAAIAKVVIAAQERYLGDAGYIIEQASTWNETGRKLYSQIEFAYGPLLLLPEVGLSRLTHLGMTQAYYIVYIVQFALGLCMLAYVLNRLPIRYRVRQVALVLFALGAITPHLGTNYTFFRFASPFALFLFASTGVKSPLRSAALFTLLIALELVISPELGLALLVGILLYSSLRAWQDGLVWLVSGVVPAVALAALLGSFGRGYLHMIAMFSKGVFNLPVGPYPHILIFLYALVWIVPVYLGRTLSLAEPETARMLGFYCIALTMISPALSRCDALHVFFDGLGFYLLSLVAISHVSRPARLAWVGCIALLVLWEHRVNDGLFSWRTALTVQKVILPHTPPALRPALISLVALPNRAVIATLKIPPKPQMVPESQTLNELVGNAAIVTPLEVSPAWEAALKSSGHYSPLYRAFGVDMMDEKSEESTAQEVNNYCWMLLATDRHLQTYQQLPKDIGPFQGIRMYFRLRNTALFVPGAIFEHNVSDEWIPVRTFEPYTLYRRTKTDSCAAE